MQRPRSPYARRVGGLFSMALILALAASLQIADAGLDRGTFDFLQAGQAEPTAWAWSPDSTSDGDGVHYVAYLGSYEHSGPAHPVTTTTITYQPGLGHGSLQAFVDWIVATYPNVTSSAELTVVRHDVTTVSVP